MAKKKKTNSKRHLRAVEPSPRRTTTAIRNDQMLDSMTRDFIDWYAAGNPDPREAVETLEMVRGLIEACGVIAPETTATSFPAWAVEQTIDAFFAAAGEDSAAAEEHARSWHDYLHYLDENDRWTGSDEDFEDSHEILSDAGEPDLPDVDVPELSETEQAGGFSELALIRYSTSLLEWIGAGKEVTQTGALRLKDITAAANCVGVSVRVPRTRKKTSDALPGLEEPDTGADPVPMVRSMHHVPLLGILWRVLQDADLISVSMAFVNTSARADRLLRGEPSEQVEISRELVIAFLRTSLAEDEPARFFDIRPEVATLVTAILVAGTTPSTMPKDRLDELIAESSGDPFGTAVATSAQRQLERFTTLGLLLPGLDYVVAPVVIQCVAALMDEIAGFADEDADEDPWGPPIALNRADDGRVYQVKISLNHAKPPIWRRVLVPSSLTLAELHAVIQRCFAWDNAHLHAFHVTRGKRVTSYAPAGPYHDDSLDESTAVLGDVIAGAGTTLTYLYDFGDSWEHRIEVEKVVDDDGRDLPVCTDGRRAAPEEDSGGVWGWEQLLETVNDPSSENHEEMRDWLGLEPGETLDGQTFDRDAVNRRLSVLRG